jgi:hypothetical protein
MVPTGLNEDMGEVDIFRAKSPQGMVSPLSLRFDITPRFREDADDVSGWIV